MAQGKEGGDMRIGGGMRLEFLDANARIGTVPNRNPRHFY